LTARHEDSHGVQNVTTFTQGVARLVAHELDHLAGTLYIDRMSPGRRVVPVDADPETRAPWQYVL
jgi:peptide deformylase